MSTLIWQSPVLAIDKYIGFNSLGPQVGFGERIAEISHYFAFDVTRVQVKSSFSDNGSDAERALLGYTVGLNLYPGQTNYHGWFYGLRIGALRTYWQKNLSQAPSEADTFAGLHLGHRILSEDGLAFSVGALAFPEFDKDGVATKFTVDLGVVF